MLDKLNPVDLSNIQDENARQLIVRLLNLVETVSADLRDAQTEIQRLREENNRLKGEKGKPNIKANKPKPPRSNSLVGAGTSQTQTTPETRQESNEQDPSRTNVGGGQR